MIRPHWVLFGDSITQKSFSVGGWGSLLADAYQRRVDVVNRGYSGYNTRWAVTILDKVLPLDQPQQHPPIQLATVFFGANDAALPDRPSAPQHVPLEEYKENLKAIVQRLQALNVPAIVLLTPPPISEPHRIEHVLKTYGVLLEKPERTNEFAHEYSKACIAVAEETGVASVDLWTGLQQVENWQETLLNDGLHFTPEGNAKTYELLAAAIEKNWPERFAVEKMPMDFPDWLEYTGEGAGSPKDVVARHLQKNNI